MNARFASIATVLASAASVSLTSCLSAPPPLGMPDASVIGVAPGENGHAIPPRCETLDLPSQLVDAGSARPGVAFGCATYSNLAAMLARPADLVAPAPYAGADASLAASAVRRYEEGRATPLKSESATSSSSSSPSATPAGSQ